MGAALERSFAEGLMNRSVVLLGSPIAGTALAPWQWGSVAPKRAAAAFTRRRRRVTDITDERMLLSVSPTQTTLYDQIEYAGNPTSFAWVLPIHGTVTVGLSADVLFDSIDALTATQITAPNVNCPASPSDCQALRGSAANASGCRPTAESARRRRSR